MIKLGMSLIAVAAAAVCDSRAVPRSVSACYPADGYSEAVLGNLRRMAIATSGTTDGLARANAMLPQLTDTTLVYQVTDSTTCAAAVGPHNQHARYNAARLAMPEAQRVYLFRYSNWWIASNPRVYENPHWVPHVVMDSTFQLVEVYTR